MVPHSVERSGGGPQATMGSSRLMAVVRVPVRSWIVHPWPVFWVTLLAVFFVTSNTELILSPRPSRFFRGFMNVATVIASMSYAFGLRVTWRRSRVRVVLSTAGLAVFSFSPLLGLMSRLGEGNISLYQLTPVVLFPAIIAGVIGVEYASRVQPFCELLRLPTGLQQLSDGSVDGDAAASSQRRRAWRRTGLVAAVLLVIVICLIIFPNWKIASARSRAEALCSAAVIGGPVAGLQTKGEDLGLAMWSSPPHEESGGRDTITGMSGWIFARWYCTIEHRNGTILSKRTYFLD
jgi:hypothetical protein